jgi:flagellar motor switch protein FliN/FliY
MEEPQDQRNEGANPIPPPGEGAPPEPPHPDPAATAGPAGVGQDAPERPSKAEADAEPASMAAAMAAESEEAAAGSPDSGLTSVHMPDAPVAAQPAEFGSLEGDAQPATPSGANIDLLLDVQLPVAIELGRTQMPISEILELGSGSIVELDKLAGEPVDVLVNNKPLAKGEVVVLDENFGVRITSLVSPRERLERLGRA